MLMSSQDYRESLRAFNPTVFVRGHPADCRAHVLRVAAGVTAVGVTYDYARSPTHRPLACATQETSGQVVNRFLHINSSTDDLLHKLEYTRLVCQETGCAMRYLSMDGVTALYQSSALVDQA